MAISKVTSDSAKKDVVGVGKTLKDRGGGKSMPKAPNIIDPLDVLNHLAPIETLLLTGNLAACVPPSVVEGTPLANVAEVDAAPADQGSS